MENWTNIVAVSTFFVLLIAELIASIQTKQALFDKDDTWVNLTLGLITFISKVGTKGLILALYIWIYQFVPFKLPEDSVLYFLLALLVNDLFFYWFHRISHTTRFFWALHVAHHSSEKLNITTAMRGNFLNNLFHAIFWIPMLFMGFSPWVVIMTDAISYFYQLWLHTRIIPKLGPMEYIFNTPSHHRVHHASNEQYIDRNYAAIFIFWDRIFGSFEVEDETPKFGLTKPFNTNNPLKVAFYELGEVYKSTMRQNSWAARVKELFRKPY